MGPPIFSSALQVYCSWIAEMERRGPIEVTNIKGFLPTSLFLLQMKVTCFPSSEKGVFSKVCNRPLLYNLRVGVEQRWFCPLMV
jgi:hypothetical protein